MFGFQQTAATVGTMLGSVPGGINDPSDISNLTCEWKGGYLDSTPAGNQDTVSYTKWWSTSGKTEWVYNAGTEQNLTINSIKTIDFDNTFNRELTGDYLGSKTFNPFALRGAFTNVSIVIMPKVTVPNGRFIYNYNTIIDPDKNAFVRWTNDQATGRISFDMRAISGGTIYSAEPASATIVPEEIVMCVCTFNYVDKKLTAYVKGQNTNVTVSEYTQGATGLNLRSLAMGAANPTQSLLDSVTYDRVLDSDEINKLGAYYSTRWGSTIWTNL